LRSRRGARKPPRCGRTRSDAGLSIIELIVALAILALLAALLVPAVHSARESSRKVQCADNLRQMGVAIAAYEAARGMFPPGKEGKMNLHIALLPYIEQAELFRRFNPAARGHGELERTLVPLYVCPSDPADATVAAEQQVVATTSYAGNAGTGVLRAGFDGLFRYWGTGSFDGPYSRGPVRTADVRDGLSNTAAIAEILHADGTSARLRVNWHTPRAYESPAQFDELVNACASVPGQPAQFGWLGDPFSRGMPWTDGNLGSTLYNHALAPGSPSCINGSLVQLGIYSAAGFHQGGVNVLFGDGHCRFIANSVSLETWVDLGSRAPAQIDRRGQ